MNKLTTPVKNIESFASLPKIPGEMVMMTALRTLQYHAHDDDNN